jgi:hypothetical protein
MKLAVTLLAFVFVNFTMNSSYADSQILKNESIRDATVYGSFNLRATDGRVLSFFPDAVRDDNNLNGLPPEKNADQKLCAKRDLETIIGLTDIAIRLADLSLAGQSLSLTASEVALVQKTPRCETYKPLLVSVANMLSLKEGPTSEKLKDITLLKAKNGNFLELSTESGAKAQLLVSSLPNKLKSLSDLSQMVVSAEASGQLLALQIHFMSDSPDTPPSQTNRTEPCSITYTRQVCEQWGHCRTETVTETGVRYITTQTTFSMTNYTLDLVNSQNQVVYRGVISDGDFNSHDDSTSACYRQ